MKFLLLSILAYCLSPMSVTAQGITTRLKFEKAYQKIKGMIDRNEKHSFKKAVFISENVFLDNMIEETEFENQITILTTLVKGWQIANPIHGYRYSDSINFNKNLAIYKLLKDTVKIMLPDGQILETEPYGYDFNDFFGHWDWRNMFVTKLLATHAGNCHSLPYLYKILSDELDATCWLGFAPNHIYIKNRCKKSGWYNTELTSGSFPVDAWLTGSGYIPLEAIQNRIYMDTLSNQQAIALCVLDLAKGYEFQTKNYYDGFIIKCCDLVLKYHPKNVQAMLLKAETLKRIYDKQEKVSEAAAATFGTMEGLYTRLFELGYREMPESMYREWLQSVVTEKEKYTNKRL
ncbi:hypothetical protein [Agriterribacter sp.]|uniref:hypothetical protein n=1 Tax=Agriterribacter sp. TaxID=2821509 RepID=UPI002C38A28C|nr:hypothetical protein [Agriterribacter sp.]HRP55738.1 hypothetical protein [Agriterribacter sp.]